MQKFKNRFSLCNRNVYAESLSEDTAAVEVQKPRLIELMGKFSLQDVFNADEFGLLYG